jgi:hypothetical protein
MESNGVPAASNSNSNSNLNSLLHKWFEKIGGDTRAFPSTKNIT